MLAQQENNNKIVPMPKSKTKLEPGVREVPKHGKTKYEVTFFVKGERFRKYFDTKTDANRHAKSISSGKKKSIAGLLALSDEIKIDLLNVYNRATRAGYDLQVACELFERGGEIRTPIKFKDAGEAFLAAKRAKGCRPRTVQTYQYIIEPFALTFGEFDFHEIPKTDVAEWLQSQPIAPRTYNNYLNNLSTVRNWVEAQNNDVGKIDPFSIEEKLLDESDPCIVEIDDVRHVTDPNVKYLESKKVSIVAYVKAACAIKKCGLVVVLVLFCGLRIEEACKTVMADIKINRKKPIVVVRAQVSKVRNKRNVELQPNAVAWLKYAIECGCVLPVTPVEFFLNRKRKLIRTGPNALRHSFCSYHLAKFKNKNETAYLAGNSPDIIDTNYKELVEPEDADEFWSLMP
tara:strand:+ start:573 stop:1778 length:1206 start_codon:yes stop_codon:yes gene_type:complete